MNYTRGAERRGNRNGRIHYPKGTEVFRVGITLSKEDLVMLRKLGNGYAPRGVRALLKEKRAAIFALL